MAWFWTLAGLVWLRSKVTVVPSGAISSIRSSWTAPWVSARLRSRSVRMPNRGSLMLTSKVKSVTPGVCGMLPPGSMASVIGPPLLTTLTLTPALARSERITLRVGLALTSELKSSQTTVTCPGAIRWSMVPWLTTSRGWALRWSPELPLSFRTDQPPKVLPPSLEEISRMRFGLKLLGLKPGASSTLAQAT